MQSNTHPNQSSSSSTSSSSSSPGRDDALADIFTSERKSLGFWNSRTRAEKIILSIFLIFCLLMARFLIALIFNDKSIEAFNIHNGTLNYDGSGNSSKNSSLGRPTKDPGFTAITPDTVSSQSTYPSETLETKPQNAKVCSTSGCAIAAAYMLSAMNTSVNPCENFFEFACGQWIRQHPIPDDMPSISTFAYAAEKVRQQLRVLLEEEVVSESKSINMARAIYRSCMNETQQEELKTSPLFETLTELGEWPLLQEKWDKTKFNLTNLLINSHRDIGYGVFVIGVSTDSKNSSRHTLFIDPSNLFLRIRDLYLNATMFSSQIAAYRKYLRNVAQLLKTDGNLSRSEAEIKVDIDKIIDFETEIAKIMVANDERSNLTRFYNKREIRDLYSLFPQIDWVPFIQSIAPADIAHSFHYGTEIIISEIEYIRNISDLIDKTDVRILTNYVIWRIVESKVELLDKRFKDIRQEFIKVMIGRQLSPPRWKICILAPSTSLPLAVGAIYVQAHFKQIDMDEASRMTGNLINAFVDMVRTNEWMDEATKAVAIEKANSMLKFIGYSNITNDFPQLDKRYSGLSINECDTYYCIDKKTFVWMQSRQFQKLTKPFGKHEFDIPPAIVNAVYLHIRNAIAFPAAILQPPFFSGSFPKAVNYGGIGTVIGHEITHGFDDEGSQYDKDGNLRNWWSNSSLKEFDVRRRCIVEQYGNYTVPKTSYRVNGKLTQGENIADNGGVKEAFKAYQKYVQENGEEPRLPGLQQYTNEQIFFISSAQIWCEKSKDAAAMQQVLSDNHSPSVFRVNGVLSNMEAFANAYNCPLNSPLNPNHKCSVW